MTKKLNVMYCRFSSDMQRTDSNEDQERRIRDGLARKGIPHTDFIVLADEAISGEVETRPAFQELLRLTHSGQVGILATSDQARLTRSDNAKSLIKDVVFRDGRFISITEGIDTDQKGWELLVGFSEIHHSQSNRDTAERVRGGLEGRILDGNGSAGD